MNGCTNASLQPKPTLASLRLQAKKRKEMRASFLRKNESHCRRLKQVTLVTTSMVSPARLTRVYAILMAAKILVEYKLI